MKYVVRVPLGRATTLYFAVFVDVAVNSEADVRRFFIVHFLCAFTGMGTYTTSNH